MDTEKQNSKECPPIITLPEYCVKRKNQGPTSNLHTLESHEGTTTGPISEKDVLNGKQEEEELPIALRKQTRACAKPIPYAMTNYLNY